jgi:hypothetical protein
MASDVRLLRTVVIDHIRPKKSGLAPEDRESRNNKAVSCSFCNCRKGGWDPATKDDPGLGLGSEEYRRKLIERSSEYIQSRPPSRFPVLPAAFFDALYAVLKES